MPFINENWFELLGSAGFNFLVVFQVAPTRYFKRHQHTAQGVHLDKLPREIPVERTQREKIHVVLLCRTLQLHHACPVPHAGPPGVDFYLEVWAIPPRRSHSQWERLVATFLPVWQMPLTTA